MAIIPARTILFDLDGTLVDSKAGITRSVQYALERMDLPSPPAESLEWLIGPPMQLSLRKLLATSDETLVAQAMGFFLERYGTVGKYEGTLYPGTAAALGAIKRSGHRVYLATSKPRNEAVDILTHFGLDTFFDGIYGSVGQKAALIAALLQAESLVAAETLMVGDRDLDILAARENSVRSVGVTYGYGSPDELRAAGPDYLFDSLGDLAGSLAPVQ